MSDLFPACPFSLPMTRRGFLRASAAVALGAGLARAGAGSETIDPRLAEVNRYRPLKGAAIPADIAARLGTAHVGGRYHLTDKPFLIEGVEAVERLGFGGIKLWFTNLEASYPFNSEWRLPADATLLDYAQHPYFAEAFEHPFNFFALEVLEARWPGWRKTPGHAINPESDFAEDERQVYELTRYLRTRFAGRDVTFLLQNWEGDWLLRGSARKEWINGEFPELERRVDAFARWFAARQRGVERARAETPDSRCQVWHAVEVNRVFDLKSGKATVTSHVLPRVEVDLVSWSCYDGLQLENRSGDAAVLGLCEGLDLIQAHARTTRRIGDKPAVYLGEFGVPEQRVGPAGVVDAVNDAVVGVMLARGLPYAMHWELYCNELQPEAKGRPAPNRTEDMRGYWLVRPDGSESYSGAYFRKVLAAAGGRLTD